MHFTRKNICWSLFWPFTFGITVFQMTDFSHGYSNIFVLLWNDVVLLIKYPIPCENRTIIIKDHIYLTTEHLRAQQTIAKAQIRKCTHNLQAIGTIF